jgi:hypothetical protein
MLFDYGVLVVNLYEGNRSWVDVAALLVDSRTVEVSYKNHSELFSMVITLGSGKIKKEHNGYYFVGEIQNRSGVRTHYGCKIRTEGFIKALEGSSEVTMLLRQ